MPGKQAYQQQQQPPRQQAQQGFQADQQLQQLVRDAAQVIAVMQHQPVDQPVDAVGKGELQGFGEAAAHRLPSTLLAMSAGNQAFHTSRLSRRKVRAASRAGVRFSLMAASALFSRSMGRSTRSNTLTSSG
ncbi:hypothetical protein D3C76_1031470 [compost metagenome]